MFQTSRLTWLRTAFSSCNQTTIKSKNVLRSKQERQIIRTENQENYHNHTFSSLASSVSILCCESITAGSGKTVCKPRFYCVKFESINSQFAFTSTKQTQSEQKMKSEENETDLQKESNRILTSFHPEGSTSISQTRDGETLSKRAQKRLARSQKFKDLKKQKKAESMLNGLNDDAGYKSEDFNESSYYFENGLRKVRPYMYVFSTHAKGRWVGRNLFEVLTREFGFDHPDQLRNSFEQGSIMVNNVIVDSDYVVKDCDYISHRIHRHENAVTGAPIEVIHDSDDVLVINKPSSIPCHPCGRYRFNSIVFILGKEMGYVNLRNIYRLDRLTSGVLVLGKTAQHTKKLEDQVMSRQVQKEYVCRVVGKFPDGRVVVDQPLKALSNKLRLQVVSKSGKASKTIFERTSYNGTSSVVKCWPETGRTHQIRVHLQYLGHPILNDGFYNNKAWGPNMAKGGNYEVPHQQVCERILAEHHVNLWDGGENPLYFKKLRLLRSSTTTIESQTEGKSDSPQTQKANLESSVDCVTSQNTDKQDIEANEPPCKKSRVEADVDSQTLSVESDSLKKSSSIGLCENAVSLSDKQGFSLSHQETGLVQKFSEEEAQLGNTTSSQKPSGESQISTLKQTDSAQESPKQVAGPISNTSPQQQSEDSQICLTEEITTTSHNPQSDVNESLNKSETMSNSPSSINTDGVSNTSSSIKAGDMIDGPSCISADCVSDPRNQSDFEWIELDCDMCKKKSIDPAPKHLIMFLHALKYKGPGWEYETSLPDWAQEDWNKEEDFML